MQVMKSTAEAKFGSWALVAGGSEGLGAALAAELAESTGAMYAGGS
jgi:short-subunit dehydrogenase